jgi:hypothetical protein
MLRRTCLVVLLASAYSLAQTDQSPHFASVKPVTRDVRIPPCGFPRH